MIPQLNTKKSMLQTRKALKKQKKAYSVTEEIASRDHNNLYVTSSFFKDRLKYEAFCSFYSVMRIVDDRIDNLPKSVKLNEELRKRELDVVNAWEQIVISCSKGNRPSNYHLDACDFQESEAVCKSVITAFKYFPVPIGLWINFFQAMRSDLSTNELEKWSDFLSYSEGATVAPTSIYLYLITSQHNDEKNSYELPVGFDLIKCGRYLGIFAYLGHIIRDLSEDIKSSVRLCITLDDLNLHDVSLKILRNDALKGRASLATQSLVKDILERAQKYLVLSQAYVAQVYDYLDNDCRFILELIISIYKLVIEKIVLADYDPMSKKHLLSTIEKTGIIKSVARRTRLKNNY